LHERTYSTLSLVSSGMGDCLRAGISPRYVTKPTRSTQSCMSRTAISRYFTSLTPVCRATVGICHSQLAAVMDWQQVMHGQSQYSTSTPDTATLNNKSQLSQT